jgi:hypothetical protein
MIYKFEKLNVGEFGSRLVRVATVLPRGDTNHGRAYFLTGFSIVFNSTQGLSYAYAGIKESFKQEETLLKQEAHGKIVSSSF